MSADFTIAVSGGFDPVHVGHLRLLSHAATYGQVVVLLNSDDWLLRKKGYVFMPWEERAEVLRAMRMVRSVRPLDDSDDTVVEGLRALDPDYFANGGDRETANSLEHAVCRELDIIELFNIGGSKIQSSSELLDAVRWGPAPS